MMYHYWTGAAGYGFTHWIMFAVMAAMLIYPIGRILMRMGLSPFWAVLAFVPLLNVLGLWILAFMAWPRGGADIPGYPPR
ncbi:MAG: hypothetical protein KGQ57_14890 [Burkholderiales bacterium]|nr:hypothetical protein [Burkholderiales bacterium]